MENKSTNAVGKTPWIVTKRLYLLINKCVFTLRIKGLYEIEDGTFTKMVIYDT